MDWIIAALVALDLAADVLLVLRLASDPFPHWRTRPMPDVVMCGCDHTLVPTADGRPPLCPTCAHQAGLSRIACACVQCELRRAANAVCRALDCHPVFPGRPTAALAEALMRMDAAASLARGTGKGVANAAVTSS